MKKNGFNRLRSLSAFGAMSLGFIAGGSVRAATRGTSSFATTVNNVVYSYIAASSYGCVYYNISSSTCGNGISDASLTGLNIATTGGDTITELTDSHDGIFGLIVDGNPYLDADDTIDYTGTTVTSDDGGPLSGLDIVVQYHLFTTRQAARAMYAFTNNTGTSITANVALGGNFGEVDSDSNGLAPEGIIATQSGDQIVDATDMWYITTDGNLDSNGVATSDVINTTTRYGGNASVVPTTIRIPGAIDDDYYSDNYVITVAPGQTVRLLTFADFSATTTGAIAKAPDFENPSAALLTGISAAQQAEVVNFALTSVSPPVQASISPTWLVYLSLPLLGLFGLRREKKQIEPFS